MGLFIGDLKQYGNHKLHSLALGGAVYYLLNKNGNPNAIKYSVITTIATGLYMSQWGHNLPSFNTYVEGIDKKSPYGFE